MNKLLIPIHTFSPGVNGGGPIKSVKNILNNIGDSFDVYVYTNDRDWKSKNQFINIAFNNWIDRNSYKIMYSSRKLMRFIQIYKLLKKEKFQTIYLNSFFSLSFSILILFMAKITRSKAKIVLAPRGEFYFEALNSKKSKKRLFIYIVKLLKFYKNIYWHATNNNEEELIKSLFAPNYCIYTIENLVLVPDSSNNQHIGKDFLGLKLVYLSRIHKHKNLHIVIDLLQNVDFSVYFDIYGPIEDSDYYEDIISRIKLLPKNISVNFKGSVPYDEANSILNKYHLFILLTKSENFGHAIFDSLSAGTPVLISNNTPFTDLESYGVGAAYELGDALSFYNYFKYINELNSHDYLDVSNKCLAYARQYATKYNKTINYISMLSREENNYIKPIKN
jgi:glycosyltransferase involved in cell wall biosynthesis